MDVFQVEERGFYLKLVSNKGEGVAASLYEALESLTSFNVQNSNLVAESERFVLTFTLNVIKLSYILFSASINFMSCNRNWITDHYIGCVWRNRQKTTTKLACSCQIWSCGWLMLFWTKDFKSYLHLCLPSTCFHFSCLLGNCESYTTISRLPWDSSDHNRD